MDVLPLHSTSVVLFENEITWKVTMGTHKSVAVSEV